MAFEPTEVGVRLRKAREVAGVTASGLSIAAGAKSRDHVRQIETGAIQVPAMTFIANAAELLGVPLDWLVYGRGELPSAEDLAPAVERVRAAAAPKTGTDG